MSNGDFLRGRTSTSRAAILGLIFLAAVIFFVKPKIGLVPPGTAVPSGVDWTVYGNGLANSFLNAHSLVNVSNVASLKIAWFAKTDGKVSGAPIAAGEYVYAGTASGTVYAFSRATGETVWEKNLNSDPINGGPLEDGGRLFIPGSDGQIFALDAVSGELVWKSKTLFPANIKDALRASPKAYNGVIYESLGGTDDDKSERGGVAALDEATGRVIWSKDLVAYQGGGAAVFSPPAILPQLGELVVATGNPTPYPQNASAGNAGPVPTGSDQYSDSVVALALGNGKVIWSYQVHGHDGNDFDFLAAPSVATLSDGTIAVGAGSKDGNYYLFDAQTGRLIWTSDLQSPIATTLIMTAAAVQSGNAFVGTMDIPKAALAWPENYQSPGEGRLVAIDLDSGIAIWQADLGGVVAAAPVASRSLIFVANAKGDVFAFSQISGKELWRAQAPGEIWNAEAGLALTDRMIIIPLSSPGGVVAFSLPG
jgi:polyvinyl alcohol dehydrogenase (cytochrome)